VERPKGILFDLGNTILTEISFDPIAGVDRLIALSDNPGTLEVKDIHEFVIQLYDGIKKDHEISRIEWPIFMLQKIVFQIFGIKSSLAPQEMEKEFWIASNRTSLEPGIRDVLTTMSREDIPMGIISNSAFSGETLLMEVESYGIAQHFDFVISSSDYGIRKPHAALFFVGASRLSMSPGDIWFIGNSLSHDINGALGVGMGAVWYNREKNPGRPNGQCLEIKDWHDFLRLLNEHA